MRTRLLTRAAPVAAAALVTVALAAAPAWAPKYIFGASAHGDCVIDGVTTRFQGDFRVTSFGTANGGLVATAIVVGTCSDDLDVVATVPGAGYAFPVLSVTGSCGATEAVVQVRPGAAVVDGFTGSEEKGSERVKIALDLSNGTLAERSWVAGDPASARASLCAASRLVAHAPLVRLAPALDALVIG